MAGPERAPDTGAPDHARHGWLWPAAVAFHLAIGVVPYLGSGLVAPPAGVAVLWAIWLAGAVMLWRLRPRARLAIWVPVAALFTWIVVVSFGDFVLGWTA